MAIVIRNPRVEEKARRLAALLGVSITAAIGIALDEALARIDPEHKPREKPDA